MASISDTTLSMAATWRISLGNSLFQLEVTCGRFLNDFVCRLQQVHCCARCCCCCCYNNCSWWLLVRFPCQASVSRGVFSLRCLVCLSPSPFLPFCLFVQTLGLLTLPSSRVCSVRQPFWLLATFVDDLAPSEGVVRCPHGSTRRFSTMSCVCSTRHSLHALNSFFFFASTHSSCPSWASTSLSSSLRSS